MKPRRMTLDLLRQKYRGALAAAAACSPPLDLRDSLSIVFTDEAGETDISESHFLSDAQCLPGRYAIQIHGPAGVSFSGEATLSDPSGLPVSSFGYDPKKEVATFISALMTEGRNQITHTGDELRKCQDRNRELEAFSAQLLRRVSELEIGRGGQSAGGDTQRELLQVLQQMACKWLGIGGAAWKPETVMHALAVLAIVQRSQAVQAAIRAEGGAEPLRLLVEAA